MTAIPLAQTMMTPEQALERLFTEPELQSVWFADAFLAQVPLSQINAIVADMKASLGEFQAVQSTPQDYVLVFERGRVPTTIQLDAAGRIATLFLRPPQSNAVSVGDAIAQLQTFPGATSLFVSRNGEAVAAWHETEPLAVGSAFKLVVLEALQQQIAAGQHRWDQVVTLQPAWKSLPSGILQDWPVGSPLTLETLATLMISRSDNTATDALIHRVGRPALEVLSPRNQPFLTTRELFVLKAPQNAALLERYQAGSVAERRQVLAETEALPLPRPQDLSADPVALAVEWLMTTEELCDFISQVADLPLMAVNPGVANPANWSQVAFKGGSEAGVLNLTTHLTAEDGTTYCVSATWNNPDAPLNEQQMMTLYSGVLEGLQGNP